ncbi:MAG TPA: hypothetical protein VFL86_27045 [Burkholderiaceae bacterium]|nr:hypothetical protein [Burkholderiaceae bacterium]
MAWPALGLSGAVARAPLLRPLGPALEPMALGQFPHERHCGLAPQVGQGVQGMAASGELARLGQEITARMNRQATP